MAEPPDSASEAPPADAFDLTDRVAIVTGGGRGLGRAMSLGLASAGAMVFLCGRTRQDLNETVAEVIRRGGRASSMVADMGLAEDIPQVVDVAVRTFGGIDIVVNNAVDPAGARLEDLSPDYVDRVLAVNFKGPLFLCQAALPYLEQSRHASVVNVLSVAVWAGGPLMYRSSKLALWGLTKTLAKEWAPKGIRVNALAPGPFETSRERDAAREEFIRRSTLLNRIATYDEIVPPLLYVASDASRFMTGSVVHIDGGIAS
jgi:NAD(P)-dependent dehydrogenase (short-subunit alcohol dehydrogenase family)